MASFVWEDLWTAVDYRIHTARTQKSCELCDDPIEPGQRYVHIVWTFPWTMIADDLDDEGRPTGGPAGEWLTSNAHQDCLRAE